MTQETNGGTDWHSARYVAIIADGNGRWARSRGVSVNAGHEAGADTLKARLCDAAELGIRELTVYSFSTENWSRPAGEVRGLIALLARRIARETPELHQAGVRMRFVGRREGVPGELAEQMRKAETLTTANQRLALFIALNYGGRAEILDAARRFAGGGEDEFRDCLYAPDMHEPGCHHPHRQRATAVELSPMAGGQLGAVVPRRDVARLHQGVPDRLPRRVPRAPSPMRQPQPWAMR